MPCVKVRVSPSNVLGESRELTELFLRWLPTYTLIISCTSRFPFILIGLDHYQVTTRRSLLIPSVISLLLYCFFSSSHLSSCLLLTYQVTNKVSAVLRSCVSCDEQYIDGWSSSFWSVVIILLARSGVNGGGIINC